MPDTPASLRVTEEVAITMQPWKRNRFRADLVAGR